jgi:hypothetical protein
MRATLVFLIVPASIMAYVILATQFGVFQDVPIAHFIVAIAALGWLFAMTRKDRTIYRVVLNLAGWALLALFAWWTLIFSEYEHRAYPIDGKNNLTAALADARVMVAGEEVPATGLIDDERGTLLVFFRGSW